MDSETTMKRDTKMGVVPALNDANGGEAASASAGQNEKYMADAQETSDAEKAFEDMIRGTYKEQFDRRVQKILEGRLKVLKQSAQQHEAQAQHKRQTAMAQLSSLERSEEDIKKVYPDFNWRQEMHSAQFARLIAAGVDGRTAYEAVHCGELLRHAVRYGAQRAGEVFALSAASGGRIAENGGQSSGCVSRFDPKALTTRELADIRRRVMRGEKIKL